MNRRQVNRSNSTASDRCSPRLARAIVLPLLVLLAGAALGVGSARAEAPKGYLQTNLISNGSVDARVIDTSFIDPWGVSLGSDFWINTTGSGLDYVAGANGAVSFTITIPPASGSGKGSPTGTVFTGNVPKGSFPLPDKSAPLFLFCTIDGTVSGWSGGDVLIAVNNHKAGAVYTAMALMPTSSGTLLLLANSGAGADVEVYDGKWKQTLETKFKDPGVPSGYVPFGVHVFDRTVYVTYAPKRGAGGKTNYGAGKGFVDSFDVTGKFLGRVIPTGDWLNAPWGMAMAPATFGEFGGDLLVGNFGDGTISAYDNKTSPYKFEGQITDPNGDAIANPGLWEIVFGETGAVGNPNSLYFAAGLNDESAGLFGTITVASSTVTRTKTTVSSDDEPGTKNEKITFTAVVQPDSGFGEPEGRVVFSLDGRKLSTSPVDSTAHATATAGDLALGKHTVTAAYSGDANFKASTGSVTETIEAPAAAPPIFSPAVGTYTSTQKVTLSDATPHAKIYYTTDGTAPTTKSSIYSTPISVTATMTIKAFAWASGLADSAVSGGTYTISTSATPEPKFSPAGGTYYSAQSVTLADMAKGAVIYYTLDGSAPTTKSSVYSAAIPVTSTTTIKAMAVAPGMAQSTAAEAVYTISTYGYTANPKFSPAAGTYSASQSVTLSDPTGKAVIYYTTDGSMPTTKSPVFKSAISVPGDMTINAMAVAPGMSPSTVESAYYAIGTGGGW
ncbi:MAG: TIGR03118 family protein [Terracidiphilus sp.]